VHDTLSRYRVKHLFLLFSAEILWRTPLTRRRVCRCSVSVVAHYRELFRPDKRKFKIIFRPRIFSAKAPLMCHKTSNLPFLQP
ncbi:TPA: hypothetical protein ACRVHR_002938, partial [Escherichia coli]